LGQNGRNLPASWKTSSYFRSFSAFYRLEDDLAVCFPVISVKFELFSGLPVFFQVVEKVKKRDLSYKKRWGKCAESEAVDFKIVLYCKNLKNNTMLTDVKRIPPPLVSGASSLCRLFQQPQFFQLS
jgi:hypothetical protein